MSRRQPVSMRDRSDLAGAVQSIHRGLASEAGPGGWGRMASAQPPGGSGWSEALESDDANGDDHGQTPTWEADDAYVLTAADVTAGVFTFTLTRRPVEESVQAAWGVLVQQPSEYDVDDSGKVSWPLSGIERAGDRFWFHYQYLPAAEDTAQLLIKGVDSAQSNSPVSTLSVPIPANVEADDLILLLTARATPPAGWTLLESPPAGGQGGSIYERTADGTEVSVLLTANPLSDGRCSGIVVVLDQQAVLDSAVAGENPRVDSTFKCPAADGATLSFAVYDGPGNPPDEHITGVNTTMLKNLNVATGLYGIACATGRATFTSTTGSSSSYWVGYTVGVDDL